jgi:hypothetical protein
MVFVLKHLVDGGGINPFLDSFDSFQYKNNPRFLIGL